MNAPLSSAQIAEIHRLMGEAAVAYNRGDSARAEQRCARVLALYPDFPQALHLLGLCQSQRGDLDAAAELLARGARQDSDNAQVFYDLGDVCAKRGRWVEAVSAYLRTIELRPAYTDSYVNLGAAWENLADHEQAERAYRRALEINPRHATAAGSLAAMCEAGNRLEEAERWVNAALETDTNDAVANLTRAQLDFRAGRYQEAAARLESLLQQPLTPRNRSLALSRLGATCEQRADYERAFATFAASKQVLNTPAPAGPGIYTLEAVRRIAHHLDALLDAPTVPSAGEQPVFLVGFPRSGTTLLDQILSSHPQLLVLEEKENLRDTLLAFVPGDNGIEDFLHLNSAALVDYRGKYWQRVAEAMPQRNADKLFIDKLPLNTMFVPLIARLFPQARFLFALRDPRDVVLSCYTRAFGLNEAMRNFLTLEGTAAYYTAVMDIGRRCLDKLGGAIHLIRYEALVADLENEARRLCAFLGVEWRTDMLKFQDTARKRRINTPSYHQVVQPIYRSAQARWLHYEKHLQPVLPQLRPFVEFFGYA